MNVQGQKQQGIYLTERGKLTWREDGEVSIYQKVPGGAGRAWLARLVPSAQANKPDRIFLDGDRSDCDRKGRGLVEYDMKEILAVDGVYQLNSGKSRHLVQVKDGRFVEEELEWGDAVGLVNAQRVEPEYGEATTRLAELLAPASGPQISEDELQELQELARRGRATDAQRHVLLRAAGWDPVLTDAQVKEVGALLADARHTDDATWRRLSAQLVAYNPLLGAELHKELHPDVAHPQDLNGTLPSLDGSDKQIAWAGSIRARLYRRLRLLRDMARLKAPRRRGAWLQAHIPQLEDIILLEGVILRDAPTRQASTWINNRDFLGQAVSGHRDLALAGHWLSKLAVCSGEWPLEKVCAMLGVAQEGFDGEQDWQAFVLSGFTKGVE